MFFRHIHGKEDRQQIELGEQETNVEFKKIWIKEIRADDGQSQNKNTETK